MKTIDFIWARLFTFSVCLMLLPAFTSPFTVKGKAEQAVEKLKQALADGLDVSNIVRKMKRVKVLGDSGKLDKANSLLDEILHDFSELNGKRVGGDNRSRTKAGTGHSERVEIIGYDKDAMEPFISRDGHYLFFNDRDEAKPKKDIHWAVKLSDRKFKYRGRVKNVNTSEVDGVPTMDRNNNFYFVSTKKYGFFNGFATVYGGKFDPTTGAVTKIKPHPELSLHRPGWLNMDIEISVDGQTLYSTQSYFPKGSVFPTKSYFFYAKKSGGKLLPQDNSKEIFRLINGDGSIEKGGVVYAASISKDEKTLFFTKARLPETGAAVFHSYVARRDRKDQPFGKPTVISEITGFAEAPAISSDEQKIYYHKQLSDSHAASRRKFEIMILSRRFWTNEPLVEK